MTGRRRRYAGMAAARRNSSSAAPQFWMNSALDRRVVVTATNGEALDLHDHLLDITLPAGVNTATLRVVEVTSLSTIDRGYDWRYGTVNNPNRFVFLPVAVSGSVATVKTLGRWAAGQTRRFALYWDSTGQAGSLSYTYLGGVAQAWSLAVTAGNTDDAYTIVAGGATYTHTMTVGQTAAQIATALRSLVNAGAVATAGGSSATVTVTAVNANDVAFTVANTGTTTPANLAVTRPTVFGVGRIGPDTDVYTASAFRAGLPYGTAGGMTKPAWGRPNNMGARTMTYTINGTGTINATSGTVSTLTNETVRLRSTGTINFARSEWAGAYTCEHHHRFYTGRKSDNTGDNTLSKLVDVFRVTLTYTNGTGYTSSAISNSTTSSSNFDIISLVDLDAVFSGNSTEAAGNQIAHFTAPTSTGTITEFLANADLTALSLTGLIVGGHGNTHAIGMLVNSVSLNGFGSQSPQVIWISDGSAVARLQLRNLTTASQIPANATIAVDFWLVTSMTTGATTVGDNLLPDELVALMRTLTAAPTVSVGSVETYSNGVADTLTTASARAVAAVEWFQDNALTRCGAAWNAAYEYNVVSQTTVVQGGSAPVDDHDANYGEAYKLAGLCLRYLRTHDAALIPLIEYQAAYHVTIEQLAVSSYGSFWEGSTPYWIWTVATPSSGLTAEGGIAGGGTTGTNVDPTFNGGSYGTINYSQGEVRRNTSIDQMHMVGLGLYHYFHLLRNEPAITANTSLRTDVLDLLSRMVTFEQAHWTTATSRFITNLYSVCTGVTPTQNVGLEAGDVANPYHGAQFGSWQISDTDNFQADPSSNLTIDNFMNSVVAPDTNLAALIRFMKGRTEDMLASDYGRHDVTVASGIATTGTSGYYDKGWLPRAAGGTYYRYTNGRTGDDHFLESRTGYRDSMNGRAPQRMIVVALTALLDPTFMVPVEMLGGSTIVREVAVTTAVDELGMTAALYLPEPTTLAHRFAVAGWLGKSSSFDPQTVDSAFTGYWMMFVELWYLVRAGASYSTYYPIGSW